MTSLFPAQRAAEEFDQVLEGTAPQAVVDRYAGLLDTATMLRSQPEVLPRADFAADLRSRLMTAAETELVPARAAAPGPANLRLLTPTRAPRTSRRLGTLAASLVLVGGTAGMAAAASGSLPGDGLYPVKRGVEQVETVVRLSDAGKGRAQLDQAATRLDEVRSLQARGSDSDLVASTLDSFRQSAQDGSDKLFAAYQAGSDTSDIADVRTFTARQMKALEGLSGQSAADDAALLDAADTLADIDQEARVLCASCRPAPPLEPPAALSAGAGAATVDDLIARPVAQAAVDIKRTEVARLAALRALGDLAQKSAGDLATIDRAQLDKSTLAAGKPPVTSTLTPDGHLAPTLTAGPAVKGLVSGVTSGVDTVTGKITGGTTPLDKTVTGVTDTIDNLTEKLTDGLQQSPKP